MVNSAFNAPHYSSCILQTFIQNIWQEWTSCPAFCFWSAYCYFDEIEKMESFFFRRLISIFYFLFRAFGEQTLEKLGRIDERLSDKRRVRRSLVRHHASTVQVVRGHLGWKAFPVNHVYDGSAESAIPMRMTSATEIHLQQSAFHQRDVFLAMRPKNVGSFRFELAVKNWNHVRLQTN